MFFKNFLLLSTVFFVITSCSKKADDLDSVIEAQECLDQFTQNGGDISVCEKKVEGLTTPAAFSIRCSIGYLREELTTSALIAAFANLETPSAANVRAFLELISFDNAGSGSTGQVQTNTTSASNSFNVCSNSQAKGATIIAAYSYITNLFYQYSCDNTSGTPAGTCSAADADIAGALAAISLGVPAWSSNVPTAKIGDIVIAAHKVSCQSGEANESLCDFFNRAVAGGTSNATAVGEAFIDALLSP